MFNSYIKLPKGTNITRKYKAFEFSILEECGKTGKPNHQPHLMYNCLPFWWYLKRDPKNRVFIIGFLVDATFKKEQPFRWGWKGSACFFPMTESGLITMFHGQSMTNHHFSPHFYWYRHLRTFPGTQTSSITSCTAASSSQRSFPGKMPWCPKEIDVFCRIFACIHCTTLHYITLHLHYSTLHYITLTYIIYIYTNIYIYIRDILFLRGPTVLSIFHGCHEPSFGMMSLTHWSCMWHPSWYVLSHGEIWTAVKMAAWPPQTGTTHVFGDRQNNSMAQDEKSACHLQACRKIRPVS